MSIELNVSNELSQVHKMNYLSSFYEFVLLLSFIALVIINYNELNLVHRIYCEPDLIQFSLSTFLSNNK